MDDNHLTLRRYAEKGFKGCFIANISLKYFYRQSLNGLRAVSRKHKPAYLLMLLQQHSYNGIAKMSGCTGYKINRVHRIHLSSPNQSFSHISFHFRLCSQYRKKSLRIWKLFEPVCRKKRACLP